MVLSTTEHWPDDLSDIIDKYEKDEINRGNLRDIKRELKYHYYYIHEHAYNEFSDGKSGETIYSAIDMVGEFAYEEYPDIQLKLDEMSKQQSKWCKKYIGLKVLNNGRGRITAYLLTRLRKLTPIR
ncbi:MAG: hypothetical protein J07HQW2_00323 [Haloquadratum walsbyi J07HQW2]|jgi:hypothetical protein|uniref:Uncharacterized protein n=2 Tax=Haloquadratum walsbyi TaxID=293091 RepID=U1MUB5_9EURY|nr:MAG: hypothetical protein J07HQW2_00323 [Haloquadratum walsbyi J07HQW2]